MPNPESIHDADFIKDPPSEYQRPPLSLVLRAYCVGLLKTCAFVAQRIKSESYYEVSPFECGLRFLFSLSSSAW